MMTKTPSNVSLAQLDYLPEWAQALILAQNSNESPPPHYTAHKTFYLFVAACDDCIQELANLHEHVLAPLRQSIARLGYELQVIDFHLESYLIENDERSTKWNRNDVLAPLLRSYLDGNAPVTVLALLNAKLGWPSMPVLVHKDEFESCLSQIENETDREWLKEQYEFVQRLSAFRLIAQKCNDVNENRRGAFLLWRHLPQDKRKEYCHPVFLKELDELLNDRRSSENILWIHRTFLNLPETISSTELRQKYFDWSSNDEHEPMMNWLKELFKDAVEGLQKKVLIDNYVAQHLDWKNQDLDAASPDYQSYIQKYCASAQTSLEKVITSRIKAIEERRDTWELRLVGSLVRELLLQQQAHQRLVQRLTIPSEAWAKVKTRFCEYADSAHASRPLIVHAPPSWGKSTFVAHSVQDLLSKRDHDQLLLYRYLGISNDSTSVVRLIRSIAHQLCLLLGEHESLAFRVSEKTFPLLWNRLVEKAADHHLYIIIVLDGVDTVTNFGIENWFWFQDQLPAHIKIVLTVNSDSPLLSKYEAKEENEEAASFVCSLPALEVSSLRSFVGNHSVDWITSFLSSHPSPFAARLLHLFGDLVATNSTSTCPSSIQELLKSVLNVLENKYPKSVLCRLFGYLLTVKLRALTVGELLDLLSCDTEAWSELTFKTENRVSIGRFPVHLVASILAELGELVFVGGASDPQVRLKSGWVEAVLREHYSSSSSQHFHQNILDYFDAGRWAAGKERPLCDSKSGIDMPMKCLPFHYSDQVDKCFKLRKMEITFYHILHSSALTNEKLVDDYLFNYDYLKARLTVCPVETFIEDLGCFSAIAKKNDPDLEKLAELLASCCYALSIDSSQLAAQFLFRLDEKVHANSAVPHRMLSLYEKAKSDSSVVPHEKSPFRTSFSPVDDENRLLDRETEVIWNNMYSFDEKRHHLVVVSESLGEIRVWNAATGAIARQIQGLDGPTDLRMLDLYRTVTLCNRYLKIFDLNEGKFLSKLNFVMNHKRPYFEVHNRDHIVVLSRNRMYVLVVNVHSGDMVSTFKAGEDRFLDSLIVSKNGEKLVCGDEVQKPFPLLVWDLDKKKLTYDLRIPQHEFITAIADISTSGHFVCCACKEKDDKNVFLIAYDLTSGQMFKKLKAPGNPCCVAISDNRVISSTEKGHIVTWDLITGSVIHQMDKIAYPPNKVKLSQDCSTALMYDSSSQDFSFRLVDMEKGQLIAIFTADRAISSCCQMLTDTKFIALGLCGVKELMILRLAGANDAASEPETYGSEELSGKVFDLGGQ